MRTLLASSMTLVVLVAACSGGTSRDPPQAATKLPCLTYPLSSYCCNDAAPSTCVGDFTSASKCSTWSGVSKMYVYSTPCEGLVAVAINVETYTMFYMYDASSFALYAVGDNAVTNQSGNLAIECGSGPEGFSVPSACAQQWLDTAQGAACGSGTSKPTSVCQ